MGNLGLCSGPEERNLGVTGLVVRSLLHGSDAPPRHCARAFVMALGSLGVVSSWDGRSCAGRGVLHSLCVLVPGYVSTGHTLLPCGPSGFRSSPVLTLMTPWDKGTVTLPAVKLMCACSCEPVKLLSLVKTGGPVPPISASWECQAVNLGSAEGLGGSGMSRGPVVCGGGGCSRSSDSWCSSSRHLAVTQSRPRETNRLSEIRSLTGLLVRTNRAPHTLA